ncbi:MAG: DUF502 domain-containing protein [Caldilineaceae bacterium SB0675_bin_29]|uniref:DUF502 domain-containing protein n=1 Tax=Caldilineaceae bacterium SB0675_bin_29 TaxID=2605266 RepID=A0A6B1GAF5_9CHLR|nr:DUF502 domain-containing protein [Caldilineaceae bacterium SB0675_bin_29]
MMPRPEPVTFHHRLGAKVASSLGRGAILLLPLLVTFWLVKFAYDKLDGFFQPFISSVFGQEVPGLSVAIIMIVLLALDALGSTVVFRTLGHFIERGITATPGLGSIYTTTKKLMPDSDTGTDDTGFNTVVRVEYPRRGVWCVGFLMAVIEDDQGASHGAVYMPSTPMPQSGWLVQVPMSEIQSIDWNYGEAMQYIVTAGVTCPTSMTIGKLTIATPGAVLEPQ